MIEIINLCDIFIFNTQEREIKLMSIRANILKNAINKEIEHFKTINNRMKIFIDPSLYSNIINNDLINTCLELLNTKLIKEWKGVVLNHTKHKLNSYRKYFTTSRSWFDQRKKAILAKNWWISIMDSVVMVCCIVTYDPSEYIRYRLYWTVYFYGDLCYVN